MDLFVVVTYLHCIKALERVESCPMFQGSNPCLHSFLRSPSSSPAALLLPARSIRFISSHEVAHGFCNTLVHLFLMPPRKRAAPPLGAPPLPLSASPINSAPPPPPPPPPPRPPPRKRATHHADAAPVQPSARHHFGHAGGGAAKEDAPSSLPVTSLPPTCSKPDVSNPTKSPRSNLLTPLFDGDASPFTRSKALVMRGFDGDGVASPRACALAKTIVCDMRSTEDAGGLMGDEVKSADEVKGEGRGGCVWRCQINT